MFSLTHLIVLETVFGICCLTLTAAAVVGTSVYYERKLARLRAEFEALFGRDAWVAVAGRDLDLIDDPFDRGPLKRLAVHVAQRLDR